MYNIVRSTLIANYVTRIKANPYGKEQKREGWEVKTYVHSHLVFRKGTKAEQQPVGKGVTAS